MKCPKCGEELTLTPMSMCIDKSYQKKNFCFKCMKRYSDKELKEMIETIKNNKHFNVKDTNIQIFE